MHQRIAKLVLSVALFMTAAPVFPASAGDTPESLPPSAADIENIVVTGQRPDVLRKLMYDFIVEIGDPASSSRGYARWRDRLCVRVYNLPDQAAAQYIANKITLAAQELGLKTRSPGCSPNLHIVFSPDARSLAGKLAEDSPRIFEPYGNTEHTTQGRAALEQFKTSDAPVRWWQITMVVDELGFPAMILPDGSGSSTVRGVASRLKAPINDAIWASLVIVDVGKLGTVKWPQLADYITLVALAQVEPNARPTGYESILNLFSADTPPRGMTDMDRTYLRALYDMDTMTLPHTQRGIFSTRMMRVLGESEEGE